MVVNVTGRHVEITDALRAHVHGRLERALEAYPRTQSVHVILTLEKYRQTAEIVVAVPGPGTVEAKAESDDLYASIDQAVEKAARQVDRWFDKAQQHKGRGGLTHPGKARAEGGDGRA